LKRVRVIFLSCFVDVCPKDTPLKTSLGYQQMLLQNEGISVLGNMPIEFSKKQNDGLGNLSVSLCSKSRNGGRAIWEHRGVSTKTVRTRRALHLQSIEPTYYQGGWFPFESEHHGTGHHLLHIL